MFFANRKLILTPSRRSFISSAAQLVIGTSAGVAATSPTSSSKNLPPQIPEWSRRQGKPVLAVPYGRPSSYESNVIRRVAKTHAHAATSSHTPLQSLHGIITPNGLFFERHHAGVPDINPEQHRLLVHGLVSRPLIFTMDDLVRFPSISRVYFLECAGNTQRVAENPGLTVQDTHGLLSCSEWTGVKLSTVLEEVGIKPNATWLLAESADGASMDRSIPLAKALDDAMLVYSQNGERLRPEQGYPLRLLLPGYEGSTNIKWLRRIKLGSAPFQTREETARYSELLPDGGAVQFTFTMQVKSVITYPSGGHQLFEHGFHEISGLAWSGRGKIRAVEVSTDGGRSWKPAQLQEPVLPKCLTRFRFPWFWDGAPVRLQSRATDEGNCTQPHETDIPSNVNASYHNNRIHTWLIQPDGKVLNGI